MPRPGSWNRPKRCVSHKWTPATLLDTDFVRERERGREGEGFVLSSIDPRRSYWTFSKAKESRFTPLRWCIQLNVLPINLASNRSKLKNFTSIHYHPSLLIGWAEDSRCSHWAFRDGGGRTCQDSERGGRRPQTHKTPAMTDMDKLPEFHSILGLYISLYK